MSLSGVFGSAAGYNLVLSIVLFMILLVMFCLNKIMRNTLLANTILICIMFYLNKHIYDIMIILIKSFLWIKLNMNLPKFLTVAGSIEF
jgi:glycerol-3-phosphate acyltransferase PlsY